MTDKQLGLLREFLTMVSGALLAYGYGSDALWQECVGGTLALVMIYCGWRANVGMESLFSLVRKVFSCISGVLVLKGVLTPEKAGLLMGAILGGLSFVWSLFAKSDDSPTSGPDGIHLLLLLCGFSFLLPSCGVPVTVKTPYGKIQSDAKGMLSVIPKAKPIVIPLHEK